MAECPAPLEQIFQKVEQESERRAQQAQLTNGLDGLAGDKVANAATAKRLKERRRGSISISRIGQLTEEEEDDFTSTKERVPRSPNNTMAFAPHSPFYQAAQIANLSTNSIASGASEYSNDHAHTEDDTHVTQMHHIVGKQSISSKMLPRRLSRAHSTSVIPSRGTQNVESTVIIGVSVQEATVQSAREEVDGDGEVVNRSRRASVVARGPIQKKPSSTSLISRRLPTTGWLSRAKTFTQKFKRKPKIFTLRPSN